MNTKRWLFLDDQDVRHKIFKTILLDIPVPIIVDYVYMATDAISALKTTKYDCVWLDHDLEDTDPHYTGMAVALFVANHQDQSLTPGHVVIHSWNTDAAIGMANALLAASVSVSRVQFSSTAPRQRRWG